MFGVYMCLFCACAVLCLGRGLATRCSLVQGVLPIVNGSGPTRAVEPFINNNKKKNIIELLIRQFRHN
jgi:hypothetical protein